MLLVHFSGKGDVALILWLFIVVCNVLNLMISVRRKKIVYDSSNCKGGTVNL